MDRPDRFGPCGPGTWRALADFLWRCTTLLAGRIDRRGMILAANPGLRRWTAVADTRAGETSVRLETCLRPQSRVRLQQVLAAGGRRGVTLWFGAGTTRSGPGAYRCWLLPGEGDTFWLWGEPKLGRALRERGIVSHSARLRSTRKTGIDALTGLASRSRGLQRLAAAVRRARARNTALACLMLDLDGFGAINDTLGHPAGDRVLRAAARVIAGGLRGSDLVARYGGDEFLIVLPGATAADAEAVAQRLRARLAAHRLASVHASLGASVGAATLGPGDRAQSLLVRADRALLEAKRQGGGSTVLLADPHRPDSTPD
jgi:diguanylate cyclase (GGDEF)-like protein